MCAVASLWCLLTGATLLFLTIIYHVLTEREKKPFEHLKIINLRSSAKTESGSLCKKIILKQNKKFILIAFVSPCCTRDVVPGALKQDSLWFHGFF